MELFFNILGCIVFTFLIIGLHNLVSELLRGTDKKCIRCPLRDECFKAIHFGLHKLCENAQPLNKAKSK